MRKRFFVVFDVCTTEVCLGAARGVAEGQPCQNVLYLSLVRKHSTVVELSGETEGIIPLQVRIVLYQVNITVEPSGQILGGGLCFLVFLFLFFTR